MGRQACFGIYQIFTKTLSIWLLLFFQISVKHLIYEKYERKHKRLAYFG